MKDRESITIDRDINRQVKDQARKEARSYSGMIQWMAKIYLNKNK